MRLFWLGLAIGVAALVAYLTSRGDSGTGRSGAVDRGAPASSNSIVVWVVDAQGALVPGAEVTLTGGAGTVSGTGPPVTRASTAADGTARLEIPDTAATAWRRAVAAGESVTASIHARSGSARSAPLQVDWRLGGSYTLRLRGTVAADPGFSGLRVRVVDGEGDAARGISVQLVAANANGDEGGLQTSVTDPQGVARFDAKWRELLERSGNLGRIHVTCEFAASKPPRAAVPAEAWGGEPVVLRLPLAGRVVVQLTGKTAEGTAYLAWAPLGPSRRVRKAEFRDGRATFESVGLGLSLEVTARLADAALAVAQARPPGPRRAGEEVRVELAVEERHIVRVFVVDVAGRPVETTWRYRIVSSNGDTLVREVRARADRSGGFDVPVPPGGRGGRQLRVDELQPRAVGLQRSRTGSAPFPDAGEIRVEVDDDPSLAGVIEGVVEDESGAPIAAAVIALRTPQERTLATTRSGNRGEFKLVNLPIGKRVDISVGRSGFIGAEIRNRTIEATSPAYRLQLGLAGGLNGRILLARGVPVDRIEVVALAIGSGGLAKTTGCAPGGRWGFDGLPPGEVRVLVKIHGSDWKIHDTGPVSVGGGRTRTLPAIDLTTAIRKILFRLIDEDGRPVTGERVRLKDGKGTLVRGLQSNREGFLDVLAPRDCDRLALIVEGFSDSEWKAGEAEVVLRAVR